MAIKYIDEHEIKDKRVLVRVDFNVPLNVDNSIANDARIRLAIPTIRHLLDNGNKLILVSHLGRPEERDDKFSLKNEAKRLENLLEGAASTSVKLVPDFLDGKETTRELFTNQKPNEILVLENIRFYEGEKANDPNFVAKLAKLADVFVNDGFGVAHREAASNVGVTKHLESYGGLLLKKEVENISAAINSPRKPFVGIIGGSKVSTKINVINKFIEVCDVLVLGGGLANTFLKAKGFAIGKSIFEEAEVEKAKELIKHTEDKNTKLILPEDVVLGSLDENIEIEPYTKQIEELTNEDHAILDIGPETEAQIGQVLAVANTIVWNGPVGLFEKPEFRNGTDFIYYSIALNTQADTILGGGDTLAAVSKKEHLENIDHISTGGGAMLEFIEKGTLPALVALGY